VGGECIVSLPSPIPVRMPSFVFSYYFSWRFPFRETTSPAFLHPAPPFLPSNIPHPAPLWSAVVFSSLSPVIFVPIFVFVSPYLVAFIRHIFIHFLLQPSYLQVSRYTLISLAVLPLLPTPLSVCNMNPPQIDLGAAHNDQRRAWRDLSP
jgi:hypothetical protein